MLRWRLVIGLADAKDKSKPAGDKLGSMETKTVGGEPGSYFFATEDAFDNDFSVKGFVANKDYVVKFVKPAKGSLSVLDSVTGDSVADVWFNNTMSAVTVGNATVKPGRAYTAAQVAQMTETVAGKTVPKFVYMNKMLRYGDIDWSKVDFTTTGKAVADIEDPKSAAAINDSNANQTTGLAPVKVGSAGRNDHTIDAGFVVAAPSVKEVSFKKVWADADNQDGIRPQSVDITLKAKAAGKDLEPKDDKDKILSITLDAAKQWQGVFSGLPEKLYNSDTVIEYTVDEPSVATEYTKSVTKDTAGVLVVTNTHEIDTVNITVENKWDDLDNQDGLRPESITVQLMIDGKPVPGKTLVLSKAHGWKAVFADLPKNKSGEPINYTIQEVNVDRYESSGEVSKDGSSYVFNHKYRPQLIKVAVEKSWDDGDNQDGLRPESVTVQLMADGKPVKGKTLVLSKANGWKAEFTGLPKNKAGKPIQYMVSENRVTGYKAFIRCSTKSEVTCTLVNTHKPKPTVPSAEKPALAKTGMNIQLFMVLAIMIIALGGFTATHRKHWKA